MKRLIVLFAIIASLPAFSQYGAVNGLCYFGGPQNFQPGAVIPGVAKSCSVTVYNAGTFTPGIANYNVGVLHY